MQKQSGKELGEQRTGLVISYFGNTVAVEDEHGQIFQCHLRRNQDLPVVGDMIEWVEEGDQTGIVTAIHPRRSLLARGIHGKMKPIAANIDEILVVMAPAPIFSEYLIDRYLIAAYLLNIQVSIVLNKMDLLDPSTEKIAHERLAVYQSMGYHTFMTSIYRAETLHQLGQHLNKNDEKSLSKKIAVLVGPSGVGKSSLITALGGDTFIKVGETSLKGAGKHTTTATRLYHLAEGGHLVDSPGVREFSLWTISPQEVLAGFREFSAYLNTCKFRDCLHLSEPDCAVQKAVSSGKISAKRLQSYQVLMKEAQAKKNQR